MQSTIVGALAGIVGLVALGFLRLLGHSPAGALGKAGGGWHRLLFAGLNLLPRLRRPPMSALAANAHRLARSSETDPAALAAATAWRQLATAWTEGRLAAYAEHPTQDQLENAQSAFFAVSPAFERLVRGGWLEPDEAALVERDFHALACRLDGIDARGSATVELEASNPTRPVTAPPAPVPQASSSAGTESMRGQTIGRYVVLETLGAGGMGAVYAAYDTELDRKVALKFLHERSGLDSTVGEARLRREAQSMARLSHPCVVPIFDVGTFDGRLFIAMELVEGKDLKHWLQERPRSWREIVTAFLSAGQGLAAAHAAGVVHRDFKPENVLVGTDGRIRVTDFGVARSAGTPPDPEAPAPAPEPLPDLSLLLSRAAAELSTPGHSSASRGSTSSRSTEQLTEAGLIVGTPRYMAPETLSGGSASEQSDQFSFCVALYHALYGQLPFEGATEFQRLEAMKEGRLRPPPPHSRVPSFIARAVARGLSAKPADRFPGLSALLEALSKDPAAQRRRWLERGASALAASLLALAVYGVVAGRNEKLCQGAEARLAALWSASSRAAIEKAFLATGRPHAAESFLRIRAALDGFGAEWSHQYLHACQQTRVHKAQTEEVLALRMACLDRRLQELRSLTEIFASADGPVVDRSVQAASSLQLRECADVQGLLAQVKPPSDPNVAREVQAIRLELSRAKALLESGRFKDGLALASQLVERARRQTYKPVIAEALVLEGKALSQTYAPPEKIVETQSEAAFLAQAAGDATQAAAAAINLIAAHNRKAQWKDSELWQRYARASVEASGNEPLRSLMLSNIAAGLHYQRRLPEAYKTFKEAAAVARALYGDENINTLTYESNAMASLQDMGRLAEAIPGLERLLTLRERVLGPNHPALFTVCVNLGLGYTVRGDFAQAAAALERARRVGELGLAPTSDRWCFYQQNLGGLARAKGDYEEAEKHFRDSIKRFDTQSPDRAERLENLALLGGTLLEMGKTAEAEALLREAAERTEKTMEGKGVEAALAWMELGRLEASRRGRDAEARAAFERALRASEAGVGKDHPTTALVLLRRGDYELARGRAADAYATFGAARAISEATLGPSAPDTTLARSGVGEAALALGRAEEARASLESALTAATAHDLDPNVVARVRHALSRALSALGQRERAAAEASSARAELRRSRFPVVLAGAD